MNQGDVTENIEFEISERGADFYNIGKWETVKTMKVLSYMIVLFVHGI